MGHEERIELSEATQLVPGRTVTVGTMRRWIHSGVRGVKLSATYSGGRWWTTQSSVERFIAEQTRRRLGSACLTPLRSHRSVDAYLLERYGL